MKDEQGYIKETITFYRPANIGRRYLNTENFEFKGKDEAVVVEEIKVEKITQKEI